MNFDFFISILFPRLCIACQKRVGAGLLCDACRATVMIHRTLFCGACDRRLFGDKLNCHPDFPYLLGVAGGYGNPTLRSLVHALKFRGMRAAAEPLSDFLTEYASSLGTIMEGATVMPIPLSRKRLRARGFNQSELIAQNFAERLQFTFSTTALARIKHTKPQSETESAVERSSNIRGCFAVADPAAVYGRKVVLIDDVTTTGATFLEAARALKDAGAMTIYALAVAKA